MNQKPVRRHDLIENHDRFGSALSRECRGKSADTFPCASLNSSSAVAKQISSSTERAVNH